MYLTPHNPGPSFGLAEPNKSAVVESSGDTGQRIGEAVYGVPSAAVPSLQKAICNAERASHANLLGTQSHELRGNTTETHGGHMDRVRLMQTQRHGGRTLELGPRGRRPLPSHDVQPWWYGYSVGHWEGDTLVVETIGFRDDVWLDVEGSPLTSVGKMIERFRRPNFGNLEIEVMVDDPKSYTHPWTVKIAQRLMLDTELIEFICNENDRSPGHIIGK